MKENDIIKFTYKNEPYEMYGQVRPMGWVRIRYTDSATDEVISKSINLRCCKNIEVIHTSHNSDYRQGLKPHTSTSDSCKRCRK